VAAFLEAQASLLLSGKSFIPLAGTSLAVSGATAMNLLAMDDAPAWQTAIWCAVAVILGFYALVFLLRALSPRGWHRFSHLRLGGKKPAAKEPEPARLHGRVAGDRRRADSGAPPTAL
jgi:hypothetical protein